MYFGACYYPEHWPRERWARDAALMQAAHVNVVRMGEFAWVKMEPEAGRFNFDWLDEAIRLMEGHGIEVILGTPTAGPPKWMMDADPSIYQRDVHGRIRGFGARRHYCFNSKVFHGHTRRIVSQMAGRFGRDRNVIAWQIDNEMGMIDTARCYCDSCLAAFRLWLQRRYGNLEALNEAWGTIFSGQTYTDWEQLHLPAYAVHQHHNPGLALDFRRFSSDSVRAYQQLQLEILRKATEGQLITTNEMGKYNHVDNYALSRELDVVSLDIYPIMKRDKQVRAGNAAAEHDMTRGAKRMNYWVLEHQSGTPGAAELAPTPRPGELRRWTYQSVARGADAIVYFRWRTLPYGIEEFWHGILQHHGEPGPKYEEVRQVGGELRTLAPLLAGTMPRGRIGLLRCYDNEWAFELQPQARGFQYIDHLMTYYHYFHERNLQMEIISPEDDYDGLALIIAPNLMMASDAVVRRLYDYVGKGGYLVTDFRAGAKETNNRMSERKLPGVYGELLGIEIETYGIIEADEPNGLRLADGTAAGAARVWYDIVEPRGAEVVAAYTADYYAGAAAVTQHRYGGGSAYYIGTEPDGEGLAQLLDPIVDALGLHPALPDCPAEVEAVVRSGGAGEGESDLIFVINHGMAACRVPLDRGYADALTGERLCGVLTLPAGEVRVLRPLHGSGSEE